MSHYWRRQHPPVYLSTGEKTSRILTILKKILLNLPRRKFFPRKNKGFALFIFVFVFLYCFAFALVSLLFCFSLFSRKAILGTQRWSAKTASDRERQATANDKQPRKPQATANDKQPRKTASDRETTKICNKDMQWRYAMKICNKDMQ